MEGTNSFEKGLHRSNSPQMQPEGSYVDAYNWIRNDSGRLTNEKMEEILQSFPSDSYTYLGSCPVQDSFILFFNVSGTASEIGIFDNTTKQYRTVFNDSLTNPSYSLNFTKEIDSVARINSYSEIVVYFVEEDNPVRRFNITAFENLAPAQYSSGLYNTVNDWNLQLNFKMPYGEYDVLPGGTLPSGTYSFAFRYVTDQNNKTTFNVPSRFINIPVQANVDPNTNTIIYDDDTLGADPQTQSGLSIKIKLKNIDDNYPLIEIIAITYLGTINSLSIRSLGTYENILDKEIIFSTDGQYTGDQISEKELLEMPVFINSAKCIEQKDNILILSNIKTKKFDKDFQNIANNIELNWSINKVPLDNRRSFTGTKHPENLYYNSSNTATVSAEYTIVKIYNSEPENKNLIVPWISNEVVTFPALFTGYSSIDFTSATKPQLRIWAGNTECRVRNYLQSLPSTDPLRFKIISDTIDDGTIAPFSDWHNGVGNANIGNNYLEIPHPITLNKEITTRTLTIEVTTADLTLINVTKTIVYKLSRYRTNNSNNTPQRPFLEIKYPTIASNSTTPDVFKQSSIGGYDIPVPDNSPVSLYLTLKKNPTPSFNNPDDTWDPNAGHTITWKWYKNGTLISGASTDSYTVPYGDFIGYTKIENTYRVEANILYNTTSATSGNQGLILPRVNFPDGSIDSNTNPGGNNGGTVQGSGNRKYSNFIYVQHNPNVDEAQITRKGNVYGNPFLLKGFQRGEIYSFSITPVYKDGSIGFAYHIPGKPFDPLKPNRLVEWSSVEDYSQGYLTSNLTGKIKHHQMPDYDKTGYIGDAYYINILNVTATNINFTPEQLDNIQGYIIGYQPRINDSTKGVVDTGFAKPYVYNANPNTITGKYKYQDSLLDGSVEYHANPLGGSAQAWLPGYNQPYSMYYSADTFLSPAKLKTGYSIQQIGYISNQILMKDPQYDAGANPPWRIFFLPAGQGAGQSGAIFDYRNLRLSRHNASFSDNYVYGSNPEYILSRFPYVVNHSSIDGFYGNIGTQGIVTFKFFMELNNWTYGVGNTGQKGNKTQIQFTNWLDDVYPLSIVPNLSDSIIGPTSAYTHLETAAPYLTGSRVLMIIARHPGEAGSGTGNKPAASRYSRLYYEVSLPKTDPLLNNQNVDSSQGCGDPRFCFVRITNDNSALYGKLENATYTPCAVEFDDNGGLNSSIILEGDTYISKIFRMMVNKNDSLNAHGRANEVIHSHNILGYYTESKNNYALRNTISPNTVSYFPSKKEINRTSGTGGILNEPWDKEGMFYNQQYSSIENARKTFSKPLFFSEVSNYTNRSIYSKQAFESELTDQYRIFPSLNFHDIPKDRGVITDTFVFNNNFYHHTEYGLWLSYFNPNTTQTTSTGQVVLGNAGVFQLPSKLILDIKGGYMGTMDKSGTNTPFGRVFLDHKQGKVFLFAGEAPEEISDLGLFSFFRDFVNTSDSYCMGYDWVNKRLLINNKSQEKVISFYPKTKTWTSFHDFSPYAYFTTNGYTYAFKQIFIKGIGLIGGFYDLDSSTGLRKNSYVTIIENTAPDSFKRFDKMEINTMSGGDQGIYSPGFVDPNNYVFNDKSFTNIHCWTDRQNTTDLPLFYSPTHDFNSYFLASYDPSKVPVNYYKGSFHLELPLDAVIDPYLVNNTDIYADFRAHMKGKFLYTKLSYKDDKPLVLNYVKTFFKPTVA